MNAYVAGPALFPTVGSPNPMLTGIALSRRLARHLVPARSQPTPETLFDGATLEGWSMAGPGRFVPVAGALRSVGGAEIGLLWHTRPTPADFDLQLEWRRWHEDANSGVFIRFPDPASMGYANPAWVAVHFGFEVQIDELGAPDGLAIHRTGAIYSEPGQQRTPIAARPVGDWNHFSIQVRGQQYTVFLNGTRVTEFTNPNPKRGIPGTAARPTFVGLQSYPGKTVDFRNIRILAPPVAPPVSPAATPAELPVPVP
jgi:hypothetical protein